MYTAVHWRGTDTKNSSSPTASVLTRVIPCIPCHQARIGTKQGILDNSRDDPRRTRRRYPPVTHARGQPRVGEPPALVRKSLTRPLAAWSVGNAACRMYDTPAPVTNPDPVRAVATQCHCGFRITCRTLSIASSTGRTPLLHNPIAKISSAVTWRMLNLTRNRLTEAAHVDRRLADK